MLTLYILVKDIHYSLKGEREGELNDDQVSIVRKEFFLLV
jgi:hypothetical protein